MQDYLSKAGDNLYSIWKVASGQAEAHDRFLKVFGFFATYILPLTITLVTAFRTALFGGSLSAFIGAMVLLASIQIFIGWFVISNTRSTYGVFAKAQEIRQFLGDVSDTLEVAEGHLKITSFLSEYSVTWLAQVGNFSDRLSKSPRELPDILGDMFAPIFGGDTSIFELAPKERLKFMLYLHDVNEGTLVPVWKRETTSGIEVEECLSRVWSVGQGHVGNAFANDRDICTADGSNDELSNVFAAPDEKFKDTDKDRYKSFASFVVRDAANEPIGVFVGTSSEAGRFDPNRHALFVRAATAAIHAILVGKNISVILNNVEPV